MSKDLVYVDGVAMRPMDKKTAQTVDAWLSEIAERKYDKIKALDHWTVLSMSRAHKIVVG